VSAVLSTPLVPIVVLIWNDCDWLSVIADFKFIRVLEPVRRCQLLIAYLEEFEPYDNFQWADTNLNGGSMEIKIMPLFVYFL